MLIFLSVPGSGFQGNKRNNKLPCKQNQVWLMLQPAPLKPSNEFLFLGDATCCGCLKAEVVALGCHCGETQTHSVNDSDGSLFLSMVGGLIERCRLTAC